MAVSDTIFKIYYTAAKKRVSDGESIDEVIDSMNKLSDKQKEQLKAMLESEEE